MKIISTVFLFMLFFSTPTFASEGKKVIELFTSQGCSSCPSADRLITKYADDETILALSYHVTYWNYLGWKDPYSKEFADLRQGDYARYFGNRGNYTPQAVVNGKYEFTGSDNIKMANALKNASEFIANVRLTKTGDKLKIDVTYKRNINSRILILTFQKYSENQVNSGENSGRMLKHINNVTYMAVLAKTSENRFSQIINYPNSEGVAVLVQSLDTGEIIGADWVK